MLMHKDGFNGGGVNNDDIRSSNDRLILNLLLQHGQLTKAELARQTGLTARAVQLIASRLINAKLIKPLPTQKGKVGQPSTPLTLSADGAYSIGIKIGRRRLTVQKSNFHFNLTHRLDVNYDNIKSQHVISATEKLVKNIKAVQSLGEYAGMAICMPQNHLSQSEDISPLELFDKVQDNLGEKLLSLSDIEAASLGEIWINKRAEKNYYYFFIGTYVTGAIIMNGRMYQGAFAGDFSDYPILQHGKKLNVKKLHECASLIHLDRCLTSKGEEGVLVNGLSGAEVTSPEEFSSAGMSIIENWMEQAAFAISQVVEQLQPILALQGVVIEAALIPELRQRLCEKVQHCLSPIPCQQGSIGASARSYGAAIAPLLHYFNPQLTEEHYRC